MKSDKPDTTLAISVLHHHEKWLTKKQCCVYRQKLYTWHKSDCNGKVSEEKIITLTEESSLLTDKSDTNFYIKTVKCPKAKKIKHKSDITVMCKAATVIREEWIL